MDRQTTKTVDEIGQLHIEGNIIPPQWFKAIRQGARADTVAVIILGEVFYWYRPTVIRDEATGDVKEIRRKFDGDKWQCSYQSMADRFGFTKRQCQDAAKRLRDAGLITLELRNFVAPNGTHLSNVLYVEPVVKAIKQITFGDPSYVAAEGVLHSDVGGITPERKTYTEIPTETPTDKEPYASQTDAPTPQADERGKQEFDALTSITSEEIAQAKSEHRQMLSALSEVCQIDLKLCAEKYVKEASRLIKAGYTAPQVKEYYARGAEWYRYDWRGQKGQPPDIRAINETIQRAVSGAWKTNGGAAPHIRENPGVAFAKRHGLMEDDEHGEEGHVIEGTFTDVASLSLAGTGQ